MVKILVTDQFLIFEEEEARISFIGEGFIKIYLLLNIINLNLKLAMSQRENLNSLRYQ